MRFLSCVLLLVLAVSVPSNIRAQHHEQDDAAIHIMAVPLPSIINNQDHHNNIINTIADTSDDHTNDESGTLTAPPLVYSQAELSSPLITTLTSPMLIAVSGEAEEDGEGESLMMDYQNDDQQSIELFTRTNEELQENGVDALFDSMNDDQNEEMMMISSEQDDDTIDTEDDDDDRESFEINAAEGSSEAEDKAESHLKSKRSLKKYRRPSRSLRRFLHRKGMKRFPSLRKRIGRRQLLKLALLAKKLKVLDMKMKLMKLLTRAIRMRMSDRGMMGGRGLLRLRSLHNKLMKKLMVMKMIKLMHLVHQSISGRPIYHRSGMRLSSRFLLRHLLRHAYRHPSLARILLQLKVKSLLMRSFLNNINFLLKKVYLLKKASMMQMGAGNRHRLYVKADRAIVNVGDGNEFKPVFYRSRAGSRVSVDDSNIPVRINLPSPGVIRRMVAARTQ